MTDATLCQNYAFMLELCQLCFYAFMPKAMLASSGKPKYRHSTSSAAVSAHLAAAQVVTSVIVAYVIDE